MLSYKIFELGFQLNPPLVNYVSNIGYIIVHGLNEVK